LEDLTNYAWAVVWLFAAIGVSAVIDGAAGRWPGRVWPVVLVVLFSFILVFMVSMKGCVEYDLCKIRKIEKRRLIKMSKENCLLDESCDYKRIVNELKLGGAIVNRGELFCFGNSDSKNYKEPNDWTLDLSRVTKGVIFRRSNYSDVWLVLPKHVFLIWESTDTQTYCSQLPMDSPESQTPQ